GRLWPRFGGEAVRRSAIEGKLDHEGRPLPGQRLDRHHTPVRLDEALDDRQPEAGARMRRIVRTSVEGFEDAREVAVGDPGAAVDYADHDPARDLAGAHGDPLVPGVARG